MVGLPRWLTYLQAEFIFYSASRVFADNLVGLGFLQSVSYIKSIPTHEKLFCCGEKWPKRPF